MAKHGPRRGLQTVESAHRDENIAEMYQSGFDFVEIAAELNIERTTVSRRVRWMIEQGKLSPRANTLKKSPSPRFNDVRTVRSQKRQGKAS